MLPIVSGNALFRVEGLAIPVGVSRSVGVHGVGVRSFGFRSGSRCGNVELRDSDNGVLLILVWPFSSVKARRPWLRV